MSTTDYINALKHRTRRYASLATRQVLCFFLYNENIPCRIISEVLHINKKQVYNNIYRTRDFIDVSDRYTMAALDEVKQHSIIIRPYTIDGRIMSKHAGYRMIIDNVIY